MYIQRLEEICCTQIRRATTQFVCRDTKDVWGIPRDSKVIGFRHGTEKSENWSETKTKVLFLTEGIIMRQVMSHDEHKYPDTILPGCRVLFLDEVHSGSTDVELILARILPRISQVPHFRLVLMSATLNIETFLNRVYELWCRQEGCWNLPHGGENQSPWHFTVSHQNS